jgi:hypothetical protein
MPFKSKAQQRFMFAAEARGELPKGKALEWAHETKNIKNLPEHKTMKKTAEQIADCVATKVAAISSYPQQEKKKFSPGGMVVGGIGGGLLGSAVGANVGMSLPVSAERAREMAVHPHPGIVSAVERLESRGRDLSRMKPKHFVKALRGRNGLLIGAGAGLLGGAYMGS